MDVDHATRDPEPSELAQRVLLLVSDREEARHIALLLDGVGFLTRRCRDLEELEGEVTRGVGALVVGEESLDAAARKRLARLLEDQPDWSDLPLILLVARETYGGDSDTDLEVRGSATLLERPLRERTLVSALRVALRSRKKQYQVREHMIERNERERRLEASEARLSLAIRRSNGGVWELQFDPCDPSELLARLDRDPAGAGEIEAVPPLTDTVSASRHRIHPEDLPRLKAALQELVDGEVPVFECEYRIRRRDGEIRWILAHAILTRSEDLERCWLTGIDWDITEEKLAGETRGHLAAIVETSATAIIGKDLDGVITSWNTGAQALFGYTAEEAVGRSIDLIIPPERVHEKDEILDAIRAGRRVERMETVRVRKGGESVHVAISASPILDEHGRPKATAVIEFDITQRKRSELALRSSERQLRKQAEKLADLNRRKNEFLAMLAHELRNPLSPILHAAELLDLRYGSTDPELAESAGMIKRQVEQLGRLVDDLLDVARLTRGRIGLRTERVSIQSVVTNAVGATRSLFEERQHELRVTQPDEPLFVEGDPLRLAQVFTNLLVNAAKYTDPGGHVRIDTQRDERQVVVSVRDDGVGIEPEILLHVFELFQQGRRPLDRASGGLGLGLALVRQLVEMHGGSVVAASEGLGHGAEFRVRLDLLPDASGRPDAAPAEPQPKRARAPRRILVVDDIRDSAAALASVLRMSGNEVHTALDGNAAIALAREHAFEVVLLDIGLPDMNGYEVARRLREEHGEQSMLLVALTGYGDRENRRRAKEAGFDHHLLKPVDLSELRSLVETHRAS